MELTIDQQAALQALARSAGVPATVSTRAWTVLWWTEVRLKKRATELARVSRPTVDLRLGHLRVASLCGEAMARERVAAAPGGHAHGEQGSGVRREGHRQSRNPTTLSKGDSITQH